MSNTETTFNTEFVDNTIENQPYLNPFTQEALTVWFEANDSIQPVFEDREEWEKREAILESEADVDTGKKVLYLPEDLNLFEMIDVVSVVDRDTYRDNPELSTQGVKKIEVLADTFKKAGVYIEENLGSVKDGRDIAEELSKKFFNYGLSLQSRTRQKDEPITPTVLSESDKRELDRWLIGKERYYKVMSRLGPNPSQEDIDSERSRHFEGYFKALSKTGSKGEGDKPWERSLGPVAKIHEKAEEGIKGVFSQPETELYSAAFRRGMEKLGEDMGVPVTFAEEVHNYIMGKELDFSENREKLYNKLEIPRLKEELEQVRSTGNIEEISKKEFEIARKIREEINKYQYESGASNPSEVIKNNYLNCLGSTLLGTSLLDEVGIKYWYVFPPEHAMTFLLTSNGKLYWQDFTPGNDYRNGREVTGDMFEGNPDILALAENSSSFNIVYKSDLEDFNISSSPDAVMASLLGNMSSDLLDSGNPEEARMLCEKGLELNPKDALLSCNLGLAFSKMGMYTRAIEMYKRAVELSPRYYLYYYNLGVVLGDLYRNDEARRVYEKGLELNPNDSKLRENYQHLADFYIRTGRGKIGGEMYNNMGLIEMRRKKYKKAEEMLEQGLKVSPSNPELFSNLGYIFWRSHRFEDAERMYREGLRIAPNNPLLIHRMTVFLRRFGREEEIDEVKRVSG